MTLWQAADVVLCMQVLHGNDVIADGVLKKYDAETQLAKEHRPMRTNQNYAKPPKEQTGVDFSQVYLCAVCLRTRMLDQPYAMPSA